MNVVIHGIGWGILAAAMMLPMKAVARKRGAKETRRGWRTVVMCLILVAVSVLEGCRYCDQRFSDCGGGASYHQLFSDTRSSCD